MMSLLLYGFAEVYDTFMDNIPYKEWAEYVGGLLEEYGIRDGLVLELGCGTGTMTIAKATNLPKFTGTAFPIICSISLLEPLNRYDSGNVWIILRSFVVNGIIPSRLST